MLGGKEGRGGRVGRVRGNEVEGRKYKNRRKG
jgi:hypothetical protein